MRKKKYILYFAAVAAAVGLGLGACSPGTGAQKETASSMSAGRRATVSEGTESGTESETGYENGHETRHETRHETELETEEGTASERTTEHIPEQGAVKISALRPKSPGDVTVCNSPVIIQKDEHTVQIQFHDENTQSNAMVWVPLEAGGGPSEYYALDEGGTLQ